MKVAVLGSGVIGVNTAWWLKQAGHDVVVVDRDCGPGLETSRASGGQICVSYSEPWANPDAPLQMLKWLFKDDAPLRFRPRADWQQWVWGFAFLRECWPGRLPANVRSMVRLSAYSRTVLQKMRADLDIDYHHLERGILNFYRNPADFEKSHEMAGIMRDLGVDRRVITVDEIIALEPALAPARHYLAGGDYTSDDESGDAWMFTQALTEHARHAGVNFMFSRQVSRLLAKDGRVVAAEVIDSDGLYDQVQADVFVVALGSFSPVLVRPLGIGCNVYPAKGYSATFTIIDPDAAPSISLTDHAHKVVYSRLGNQLRMAGMAELSGYSRALDPGRCAAMKRQAYELFHTALDFDDVSFWSGLRPATPSGVPLIGQTRIPNLYLNTGHGTLGWTMAAGSGRAIADLISGIKPEPEFPFLG